MRRRTQQLYAVGAVGAIAWLGGACGRVSVDAVRADVGAGHGHLIGGVPFIPQDDYQCGPAALAMVLNYYGAPVGRDEIARELYLPSARGTLNLDLEFYARRRGFEARAFEGTLDRVRDEIRRGRPLIVFQDLGAPGYPVPHFAVLLGFDDRAEVVVLHSGTTAHRILSYEEFTRTWARRRFFTLLVTPRFVPEEPGQIKAGITRLGRGPANSDSSGSDVVIRENAPTFTLTHGRPF